MDKKHGVVVGIVGAGAANAILFNIWRTIEHASLK